MGYLTPDVTPGSVVCRALFIPNDEQYLSIVRGALQELTFDYNWTKYGALSPQQSAANFIDMFDRFCLSIGQCRLIGEIVLYAGATPPDTRFLECDGSEVLIADYPDLYAVIGATYGAASTDHFKLPDLRGRAPIGMGTGTGLTPIALGDQLGENSHTLTEAELASHAHTVGGAVTTLVVVPGEGPALAPSPLSGVTGYTGGGMSHNNMQPSLGVNYLIYAKD